MRGFEKQGVVPKVPMRSEAALLPAGVPETDEEIAKVCLWEACVLALGPVGDKRTKLQALGQRAEIQEASATTALAVASASAEDWLREAIMAGVAAAADNGVSS